MKPSTLAWATCILLFLGQIIFFYAIVSPQLQRGEADQQVTTLTAYSDADISTKLTDFTQTQQDNLNKPPYKNHIDQVEIVPQSNGQSIEYTIVVVYHPVSVPGPN